ncbi:hypothetical protein PR202_gb25398 [Eleusine coracana subsp. coracana]|uniref:Uncharacterized protein n=1 Tax=Eleusine coracana subsp. coracana TaxID=191504 RepID=A0AAV5FNV7_ELECO|nr:hypothetical protein PR202_gb25398 [Eleusine coracana subsp. coracana]
MLTTHACACNPQRVENGGVPVCPLVTGSVGAGNIAAVVAPLPPVEDGGSVACLPSAKVAGHGVLSTSEAMELEHEWGLGFLSTVVEGEASRIQQRLWSLRMDGEWT